MNRAQYSIICAVAMLANAGCASSTTPLTPSQPANQFARTAVRPEALRSSGVFRAWRHLYDGVGDAQVRFQLPPHGSHIESYAVVFPLVRSRKDLHFGHFYYRAPLRLSNFERRKNGTIAVAGSVKLGGDLGVMHFHGTLGKVLSLTYRDARGRGSLVLDYVGRARNPESRGVRFTNASVSSSALALPMPGILEGTWSAQFADGVSSATTVAAPMSVSSTSSAIGVPTNPNEGDVIFSGTLTAPNQSDNFFSGAFTGNWAIPACYFTPQTPCVGTPGSDWQAVVPISITGACPSTTFAEMWLGTSDWTPRASDTSNGSWGFTSTPECPQLAAVGTPEFGIAVPPGDLYFIQDDMIQSIAPNATATTLGNASVSSTGLAVDTPGNIFVSNARSNNIIEIPASGGAQVQIASGLAQPRALAVDASDNLYVALTGAGSVAKILPSGSAQTLASGFSNPLDLAVDAVGNVYVVDAGTDAIKEIAAESGSVTTILSVSGGSYNAVTSVAVDPFGNVYAYETTAGRGIVYKRVPGGTFTLAYTTPGHVEAGFSPSMAVDGSGTIYLVQHSAIISIAPNTSTATIITRVIEDPFGNALSLNGTQNPF
jgi:streptogramin lyase